MIKINIKKIICLMLVSIFLISTYAAAFQNRDKTSTYVSEDIDPLVDLNVTVTIKEIRAFDKIDWIGNPDFYVKLIINGEEFTSDIWPNQKYVKPNWSVVQDVSDYEENVSIKIQLWDWNPGMDKLCDINSNNNQSYLNKRDVDLVYSLKTGHWRGDDYIYSDPTNFDLSGYGRLNGCDDNSIYQRDRDCELWFDISQNDYDDDGIPYWTEFNIYRTDPEVDNTGMDDDGDGVPIEWEYKWGHYFRRKWHSDTFENRWIYDPFEWEDHANLDPDIDGLNNIEEYLTSQWGSDPFRKDLFIELDQMEAGPDGEPASIFPERAKELLRTAYNKHNIVYHLDDGSWEDSGSEMIPFDTETTMSWGNQNNELMEIYDEYFLHGDPDNWRRGVFHYGVLIYQCSVANGNAFGSNRFQISSNGMEDKARSPFLDRDIVYASAYMHETGHTLDIYNAGVDDENSKFPWQLNWWKWRPYKSVMNYGYMFLMVDYSDGSRGKNDFDDWNRIDLTFFQTEFFWR